MKKSAALIGLALLTVPLAACGSSDDNQLATRVEDAADNRATEIEAMAANLEQRAEQVRDTGERRAAAIDAADVNGHAMSNEHQAQIIANEAAAVR